MAIEKLLLLDKRISDKLRLREEQLFLERVFSLLAHSGDSWYIEIVLFIIWILSDGLARTVSAYFAGSVIIQALIVILIKFLIKRERPQGAWGEIYRKTDPHSFPSGHAARAIMLAVLSFGFNLPFLPWAILVWGICLSVARVSLGVHFLIDIIAGWGIGALLGILMLSLQPIFFKLFPFVF
jgi:membrane-associated phospholipid phosphatase